MKTANILIILAVFLAAIALTASLIAFKAGPTGYAPASPGDTIILRPVADTYQLDLNKYGTGYAHWDKVNEIASDGDSRYVYDNHDDDYDLYEFEDSSENLNIAAVKVVMNCRRTNTHNGGTDGRVNAVIWTYGESSEGAYEYVSTSYANYSFTFPFSPHTGDVWNWNEINSLQAGPEVAISGDNDIRCTQVWLEVETCAGGTPGECECDLTEVNATLADLSDRINNTNIQLSDLNNSFNSFVNWTNAEFSDVWDEIDGLQAEIDAINDSIDHLRAWSWSNFWIINNRLNDMQSQIDNLQDDMWNMLVYGFHDIITSTRIETYYNPTAEDPISFVAAVPRVMIWWMPVPSLYRIAVSGTGPEGDFYQVLEPTIYIQPNTMTDFVYRINFDEVGTYDLRLVLQRPEWWFFNPSRVLWQSQEFEIDVVALESFIENSTINITNPESNSNNLSSDPDAWWQQSGLVWMNAILGENTPGEDDYCDVYYNSNLNYSEYLVRLPVVLQLLEGNASKYCQGNVPTSKLNNGAQGVYDICIEAEFIAGPDAQDCIKIGVDNLQPIIYGAWPSEDNAVNGTKFFYADVSDDQSDGNWSGVETVWLEIINKTGGIWYSGPMSYQSETTWGVWIDTTLIEDNYYNLTVTATDAAGNSAFYWVDPIIDNTPPVVNSIDLSSAKPSSDPENLFYRGYPITITANVTDNLAGVNDASVYAIVDSMNVPLIAIGGNLYSGEFTLPFDDYNDAETVTVYAEDNATNPTSESREFNLTYSYNVTLILSPSAVNRGEDTTAYGDVAYDNGTVVDNETVTITSSWNALNVITIALNGAYSTEINAPNVDGTHTVTASVTADNGETFTDAAQLTVPRPSKGGGGGGGGAGGCTVNWVLMSCGECQADGTQECAYEDKYCGEGTKTETIACTYIPGEFTPLGEEVLPEICNDGIDNNNDGAVDCNDPECINSAGCAETAPISEIRQRIIWPYILGAVGILAIIFAIIAASRLSRLHKKK
jgi:hypothetical protein